MPKAKLSQIATTWMDEGDTLKKKRANQDKNPKEIKIKEQPRRLILGLILLSVSGCIVLGQINPCQKLWMIWFLLIYQ